MFPYTEMGHGLLSHGAPSQALYSVTMVACHLKVSFSLCSALILANLILK